MECVVEKCYREGGLEIRCLGILERRRDTFEERGGEWHRASEDDSKAGEGEECHGKGTGEVGFQYYARRELEDSFVTRNVGNRTCCVTNLWREQGDYDSWRYEHWNGLKGEVTTGAESVDIEDLFRSVICEKRREGMEKCVIYIHGEMR